MLSQSPAEHDVVRGTGSGARMRAIDLRGQEFRPSKNGTVLFQNDATEVASFRMSAGERRPLHVAQGEAVIYCVEGYALLHASDAKYDLTPGVLVCLAAKEPHRLEGIEAATLLTINSRPCETQAGQRPEPAVESIPVDGVQKPESAEKDVVQEAAEESFPASDPPSWTTGVEDVTPTQQEDSPPFDSLAEMQRRKDAEGKAGASDRTRELHAQRDNATARNEITELKPDETRSVDESNRGSGNKPS